MLHAFLVHLLIGILFKEQLSFLSHYFYIHLFIFLNMDQHNFLYLEWGVQSITTVAYFVSQIVLTSAVGSSFRSAPVLFDATKEYNICCFFVVSWTLPYFLSTQSIADSTCNFNWPQFRISHFTKEFCYCWWKIIFKNQNLIAKCAHCSVLQQTVLLFPLRT